MIDDAVNIRGLKRMAADAAGYVAPPKCAESTGKNIAVVGGGPGGLSAAYFLQLMGHQVTVYEMLPKLEECYVMEFQITDFQKNA